MLDEESTLVKELTDMVVEETTKKGIDITSVIIEWGHEYATEGELNEVIHGLKLAKKQLKEGGC